MNSTCRSKWNLGIIGTLLFPLKKGKLPLKNGKGIKGAFAWFGADC